jgi:hypothetical protein
LLVLFVPQPKTTFLSLTVPPGTSTLLDNRPLLSLVLVFMIIGCIIAGGGFPMAYGAGAAPAEEDGKESAFMEAADDLLGGLNRLVAETPALSNMNPREKVAFILKNGKAAAWEKAVGRPPVRRGIKSSPSPARP